MASNKRKLEEDDHNNDQEDEHNNDRLNPVVNNEVRSRSRTDGGTGVEQQQLVPYLGSLNQPGSSSNPSSNPGQLLQQPSRGSLNQPRSSSVPAVNRASLHQLQSPRGSLNQPRSSSKPAVNRASLHQLQSPRGSMNQPRSSSKPAVNRASLHQLQSSRGSLNQPRSSTKPVVNPPPLLQLLPPRSEEVQQNPLPPSRSTQEPEPDLQLTLMTSQQSSHPSLWDRSLQDLINALSANMQTINAELHTMGITVAPTNVQPSRAFLESDCTTQLQWIHNELNLMQTQHREFMEDMGMSLPSVDPMPCTVSSQEGAGSTSSNVLLSTAQDDKNKGDSDNAKLPVVLLDQGTKSGPGSTSGNINTGDESERPVNTAAGDSDEKQGEEENADTSEDGNTKGSSSAR